MICKPININKIHRFLGEYFVVDYAGYGATELPKGNLELYYDNCDKKVYVYQNDIVYGSLKLNELEQRFIFAILSAGMNLLECSRTPSDDKTPLDQKFKVSLWMKCMPFGRIPKDTSISMQAVKEENKHVTVCIYRNKVKEEGGEDIKPKDFYKYQLEDDTHILLLQLDNNEVLKVECNCCTIAKVQGLLGLFHECCKDKECEC